MKRPSFQFYPEDWLSNSNLRRCSHEEKGIWMDVLCLLHDQEEEYGVVRWPLKDIASAVGCSIPKIKSLVTKGVLKGSDEGKECPELTFTPRHGRKDGPTVTLIESQNGPLWYSSRMVTDEYKRRVRSGEIESPKDEPKTAPKGGIGETIGDTPKDTPFSHARGRPSPSPSPSPVNTSSEVLTSKGAKAPSTRFVKPTIDELVREFSGRVTDPLHESHAFLNHYESNGWKVGKNPMKSWPHAVTNWITRSKDYANRNSGHQPGKTRSERNDESFFAYLDELDQQEVSGGSLADTAGAPLGDIPGR